MTDRAVAALPASRRNAAQNEFAPTDVSFIQAYSLAGNKNRPITGK
jgi:hypothetical protein